MIATKRHPVIVALDEWFATPDGNRCMSQHLRLPDDETYLKNRLTSAFIAGWNACENQSKTVPVEKKNKK